jgi:phenylacetic acid degradation operon negative regulatory protein
MDSPSLPLAIAALLRRFRRRRPLRAGSLLITIFGDAIAPRGGRVSLGSLIELAAAFGLTERLVRTSVGRLAQEGWLATRRAGRRSEYRLSERGAAEFAAATERIYGAPQRSWDNAWTLLLPPLSRGVRREEQRAALSWLGFGEVRPGVFAHPDSRVQLWSERLPALGLRRSLLLRSCSADPALDRQIADAGWDLGDLGRGYRAFIQAFRPLESSGLAASARDAFIVRTLSIHDYRKIHLRDPLLPAALLPADWEGLEAHDLCARLYAEVFDPAERFLSAVGSTLDGALPPAGPATRARFAKVAAAPPAPLRNVAGR